MNRHKYSIKEEAYIRKHYPTNPTKIIAEYLGVTVKSVYAKANLMSINKTIAFLSSPEGGRMQKGSTRGINTQFKKGNNPLNKGKKQNEYMSDEAINKTKLTRFKKGHIPHNIKQDGNERVSDGYIYIRINGIYLLKHRWLWEQSNGVIPENMNIVFINKNTIDVRLDNLELISDEELMLRNSIQRYPKDLRVAMQTTGKLISKINNYGTK